MPMLSGRKMWGEKERFKTVEKEKLNKCTWGEGGQAKRAKNEVKTSTVFKRKSFSEEQEGKSAFYT
jgi:hypothetical protein